MTATEPGAPSEGGLSGVLKRGMAMAGGGVVICQLVIVVQTIVLGRLLGPAEVGAFAAGSVLMGFLLVFSHGTLSQALVVREHDADDMEDAANTVLTVNFASGLVLGIVVLVSSPLMGHLFHSSRIGLITAATSGMVILHLISTVPEALMQRRFQFNQRIVVDPVVKVVFTCVSIAFAVAGYGAWSMVIGSYVSIATEMVMTFWMAKWRPFQGRFSFPIWSEMARFSFPLLIDGIAESLRRTILPVLVGRQLGTADLGQYRYGDRIASMPSQAIIGVCGYVLFPAFSRISGDGIRFRAAFLRALGWTWFAALPFGAMVVLLGEPVVVLLLGEEWRPAGIAAAAMAGIGLGTALDSVGRQVIKGAGRSKLLNWLTALGLVLSLPLLLLLLPFGLIGVGIAVSITFVVVGVVSVALACSVTGTSFRDIVASLGPSTLSVLLAFGVVFPLGHYFVRPDEYGLPLGLASVVAECLLFLFVYLCVLRFVSPTRYRLVRDGGARAVSVLREFVGRKV